MEHIVVTKFKSLDGNLYDTEHDALAADARWSNENTVDLEKEILLLTNGGNRYIKRQKEIHERSPKYYPILFVEKQKHGNNYYLATNPDSIPEIFFKILKENNEWGFYYTVRDKSVAENIIKTENKIAAIKFILDRSGYEYESVDTETLICY